ASTLCGVFAAFVSGLGRDCYFFARLRCCENFWQNQLECGFDCCRTEGELSVTSPVERCSAWTGQRPVPTQAHQLHNVLAMARWHTIGAGSNLMTFFNDAHGREIDANPGSALRLFGLA